ncbi:MAG TPA: hypothetical protein VMU55_02725 [Solirubrobacteraceae bacterium]|nr:hypothetical protein [Solirubrobacteraceae bacterium]
MPTRRCFGRNAQGEPCGATPRGESGLCLWHDPELKQAADEARRAGGQRRKRDATLFAAYDLDGVRTVDQSQRLVEVAVSDLLEADRGIPRAKALLSAARTAADLQKLGELEERLEAVESVLGERLPINQRGARR